MSQEKSEPPSWWKLGKARARGEIPNSREVNSAAAFAAAMAYLMLEIDTIVRDLQNVFQLVLRNVWTAGNPADPTRCTCSSTLGTSATNRSIAVMATPPAMGDR